MIKYSKENNSCIFFRLPFYYKELYGVEGIIKWAKDWKADAILAQWDLESTNLLEELQIPVVLQNYHKRSDSFSNLTGDYYSTGSMAAQFFIRRRYQNFAFCGYKNAVWSRERAEGYQREIEKVNGNYFHFEIEKSRETPGSQRLLELNKWLCTLPKPLAILAGDDNFALHISEICNINNFNIPKDIALLGVDNDELICNLSDPPISSIVLDVEKGGYEVGRLLHQLITKERMNTFNIVIHATRIELRQSTENYVVKNKYVLEVVNYIKSNFKSEITTDFLTDLVPLSRRNLEIKFKQEMGTSLYQFILETRIENFTHLLLTTDKPLYNLTLESGFKDSNNISRIFKKFKGTTPIEFRKKYKD